MVEKGEVGEEGVWSGAGNREPAVVRRVAEVLISSLSS